MENGLEQYRGVTRRCGQLGSIAISAVQLTTESSY